MRAHWVMTSLSFIRFRIQHSFRVTSSSLGFRLFYSTAINLTLLRDRNPGLDKSENFALSFSTNNKHSRTSLFETFLIMCRSTSDLSILVWIDFLPNYWITMPVGLVTRENYFLTPKWQMSFWTTRTVFFNHHCVFIGSSFSTEKKKTRTEGSTVLFVVYYKR